MSFDWYTSEVKSFIGDHLHDDVTKLLLNPPKEVKTHIRFIADQILARQKAKKKLPGWYENFDLIFPPPLSIEQSSSLETARYKAALLRGHAFADLTGGMGVDALTLSENFEECHYVEQQENLVEAFRHNVGVLEKDFNINHSLAEQFLDQIEVENFSLFLDPARRNESQKVFKIEDCTPNLLELLPKLQQARQVLIKLSPILDIHSVIEAIPTLVEVHVVSVKNECKEILVALKKEQKGHEPKVICVNLPEEHSYEFVLSEEAEANAPTGQIGQYIYEPNSSIMKAGAFKKIAEDFKLTKLHPNTHLYSSIEKIKDFPGRTFEIMKEGADKKDIASYAPKNQINVITRNYPEDANQLKKRLKIKDGGEYFLIGTKDFKNKAKLLIARLA